LSFSRIAVTGLGAVSALGFGADVMFRRLCAGERGIGPLSLFDPLDARARVVGQVTGLDVGAIAPGGDPSLSRTDAMALLAAREALAQAGRHGTLGVAVGGTTGGMLETEAALVGNSAERVEPERARRLLDYPLDWTATHLAAVLGAVRHSTVCAACASGAVAIARAVAWLERGEVDQALGGGADGLCRLTFFGFNSLGALDPGPCRPFDRARRGLNLGEGAGFLLLEREETARARGAQILGFLVGASIAAEAHHITHPEPSGAPSAELIRRALRSARLERGDVGYVNAHGTGTAQNDSMEARALHGAFGEHVARVLVSSSKGQLGHTLGAAGALEAVVTVLGIARGTAPPTAGLEDPEDSTLRHVVGRAVATPIDVALSCSFGFGGTGSVLVFEHGDAPRRGAAERAVRGSARRAVVTGRALLGPGNVLDALDPERSRRFDRAAAGVTFAARAALEDAGLDAARAGLVAGSAYGSVERSVEFVRRVLAKGVRRANPAEFPHLVASAAPGNASLYLGLRGPVLGVAGADASAESALDIALALLPFADGGLVAGAAEALDPIVTALLGPLRAPEGSVPRGEGAGFVVVEDAESAIARGARIAAFVEPPRFLPSGSDWKSALLPPRDPARAAVVTGAVADAALAALAASGWGAVARRSALDVSGYHEAVGAIALSLAVSLVLSGDADEVLAVNGRGGTWVTRFVREGTTT
jgi:3-oxoacyl-[acyl-carrier-protein] synthase II